MQADRVLATLCSLFRSHAREDDGFTSPIVPGMQRDPRPAEERKRERILSDDELRALWQATEEPTPYNGLIRMLLLTAQRWAKVVAMQHPTDRGGRRRGRCRGRAARRELSASVKLPQLALDVIAETPQIGRRFVFPAAAAAASSTRGGEGEARPSAWRRFPGASRSHHDLRRTARSLMARAGVPREHAERVLGHVLPGVEGTYDRHDYAKPRRPTRCEALARMIGDILDPQAARNVVPLPLRART